MRPIAPAAGLLILVLCSSGNITASAQTRPADAALRPLQPHERLTEPLVRYELVLTPADPAATSWDIGELVRVVAYLAADPLVLDDPNFHVPDATTLLVMNESKFVPGTVTALSRDAQAFVVAPSVDEGRVQIVTDQLDLKDAVAAAAARVQAALTGPKPPKEQAEQRLRDIEQRLADLSDKMQLLLSFSHSTAGLGQEILKDRMKAAELERQRLEMDLIAQRVRSEAITEVIERIQKDVEERLANDEVLRQLREVIQLRQEEAARVRQLIEAVSAPQAEYAAAQEKVMQARIRVTEREEALRQGTKASLLERLNDELATIMIDRAEMEVRLAMLREHQPPLDVKELDEKTLERLTEQYRPLFRDPGRLPPLYYQLQRQAAALNAEKLALLVKDVKVTTRGPATRPAPASAPTHAGP